MVFSFVFATGFSIEIYFYTLDLEFFFGKGPYWMAPRGDRLSNIIGMRYCLSDAWRFPLFNIDLKAYPFTSGAISVLYVRGFALLAMASREQNAA